MHVKGIRLAWIVVSDIKKAVAFYTQIIGMSLHVYDEKHNWAELVGEEEGARLGIVQRNDHELIQAGQNAIVTLSVEDIQKARDDLLEKGVKVLGEITDIPGVVRLQLVQDLDGNHFQLVETYPGHL